jgi:23S rRNA pseudouridine1911/1915/1917 synthase
VRSLIGRHPEHRKKMAVVARNGKQAVTHYAVEKRLGDVTLVRCRIETGRTHQIRVHMQSLGCPVVGDSLYGRPSADKQQPHRPDRQMLHAARLSFAHPVTGAAMSFEASLPPDFQLQVAGVGG